MSRSCSLVLTNYNGVANGNLTKYLPRIVEATRGTPQITEIVLADDGSTDGSADYVRREFPAVRLLALTPNRGFSIAANAGFAACQNRWVALLSNDMVPHADWMNYLATHFDDPDLFAVSARTLYPDGRPQSYRRVLKMVRGRLKRIGLPDPASDPAEYDRRRFGHFGDAWSLYDRDKFLEIGGFDDGLFLPFFSEDEDLFYRAWKRGWKVTFEPRARVVHHHFESSTILHAVTSARRERIYRAHGMLYMWKNLEDPWFRLQHRLSLGVRCISSAFSDWGFYSAFREALRKRHLVHRPRPQLQASRLTDRQALQRMHLEEPR